jgi:cytosine/adenosine deaminase-related metal-dependent hydrolase
VLIEGGRIKTVSDRAGALPAGSEIDARGRTVMPGLIDCHMHVFSGKQGQGERAFRKELQQDVPSQMKEFLRHGVTTIKSTGDPVTLILELREQLKNGAVLGPRLLVVGPASPLQAAPATTICQNILWRSEHAIEVAAEAATAAMNIGREHVDAVKGIPSLNGKATSCSRRRRGQSSKPTDTPESDRPHRQRTRRSGGPRKRGRRS